MLGTDKNKQFDEILVRVRFELSIGLQISLSILCFIYIYIYILFAAMCPAGRYGVKCLKSCSTFCAGSKHACYANGKCKHGCHPGYTNPSCRQSELSGCVSGIRWFRASLISTSIVSTSTLTTTREVKC